ncbi:MAG: ATP-binding protein [Treponema sp.]|nr:ATP-binding protein [Treponema sp.]
MKRKLPIGIQDFTKIREDRFCYVDKTALIHQLVSGSGKTFFLSRPRRFGKSLLCSTLGAFFEGRRELFTGIVGQASLAVDSLDWDWKKHPVIRLDLNPGDYERGINELFATINTTLDICAGKYGVTCEGESLSARFTRLINNLHEKTGERVAVIIDEYDKPLLGTIDNPELHKETRSALKGFYGVLKSSDEHLAFVFLTGVTKFSQVSVFSELNNLIDLTLDPRYAALCGITQDELEQNFEPEIAAIVKNREWERNVYLDRLRRFYNGYRFSRKPLTVYNPFGLLSHFDQEGEFLPYWYETGTPTFLIKLIEEQRIDILDLRKQIIHYGDFKKYDAENMEAVPVLYQSGYLTITDYDDELTEFTLGYPNDEVRTSFASELMEKYLRVPDRDLRAVVSALPRALLKGDVDAAMNALKLFFASIPYDLVVKNENYYQTVVHLVFTMLGMKCRSEVRIADGRIDTLVETNSFVYCFEFKLDGTAAQALKQINDKDYLLPWQGSGKKLFKVGVNFDHEKRNIGEWEKL